MFEDVTYPEAVGSFRQPVDVPGVEPDAGSLVYVCFSATWQPYIIGCLKQLLLQRTWNTTDPDVLWTTQQQAFKLIEQFKGGCLATGSILAFAGATAPDGWLICDGSSVLRSAYPDLFAVCGTTFGSVDGTHFSLPDLRGRVAVGSGTGSGLTPRSIGDTFGEETHTLTVAEIATHSHTDAGHSHAEGIALPSIALGPPAVPIPSAVPGVGATAVGFAAIGNSGSSSPHNNLPPSLALNFIIKT